MGAGPLPDLGGRDARRGRDPTGTPVSQPAVLWEGLVCWDGCASRLSRCFFLLDFLFVDIFLCVAEVMCCSPLSALLLMPSQVLSMVTTGDEGG